MASSTPLRSIIKPRESNNSAASNGNSISQGLASLDAPKTNQRGHNKPKCIKCGNVARSRCPFQSCKNCCSNAQNPCHIHVLKQSNIIPAPTTPPPPPPTAATNNTKTTTPATAPEPPPPDVLSSRVSWRLSSLKRYSNHVHMMRTKKPLTRKDIVNINKHRFSKLREHIERNIEAENESFDRYMWNVSLLEETFSTHNSISENNSNSVLDLDSHQNSLSSMKLRLASNDEIANNQRQRTQTLIDRLLKKLHESDSVSDNVNIHNGTESLKQDVVAERTAKFSHLIEKLSKARTEDDVQICLELKKNILSPERKVSDQHKQETGAESDAPEYSLPRLCTAVRMDEEALSKVDVELSSLGQLGEL